jgi:Flp pilus assembly protein TadG
VRNYQQGLTTVEFAIVGAVFFVVLFGVIEFGRALFVANVLVEGTRRGARLAAVCPVGSARVAEAAVFANASGDSRFVHNLDTGNVVVAYLNQAGAPVPNPGANIASISYVRVSIVDYRQTMLIPFVMPDFLMPSFVATLPAESLGYSPTDQAFSACPQIQ